MGRHVTIYLPTSEHLLVLQEVEVYGRIGKSKSAAHISVAKTVFDCLRTSHQARKSANGQKVRVY